MAPRPQQDREGEDPGHGDDEQLEEAAATGGEDVVLEVVEQVHAAEVEPGRS
jgi:hypothetical protein